MAITGRVPLKKWQAAIEATPGTILAATRLQPMLSGDLVPEIKREYPKQQRGSFIANYGESYQYQQSVSLQGCTTVPTFEDLPWFLQAFAKGSVTAQATAVTAYNYTFTPTVATDDLQTVNWEVAGDTQTYSVPFSLGTRFRLEGGINKASVQTADYVAQRHVAQSITSNLSLRTTEAVVFAKGKAYIDSATIGTTQVYTVLDFSFELETGQKQHFVLDGNLYPRDSYRGETRMANLEATLAFTDTIETASFSSNTQRKVRFTFDGSNITGSSPATTKRLTLDWYGKWAEAPFAEQDGLVVIKVKGESEYDSAAGHDWRIQVTNDLPTLP